MVLLQLISQSTFGFFFVVFFGYFDGAEDLSDFGATKRF